MQKSQGDNLFMDNTHNWLLPHTVIIICVLLVLFVFCHIAIYCTYDIIDNSKTAAILILHIAILCTGDNIAILPNPNVHIIRSQK